MRERIFQDETERSVLWRLITGKIPCARYYDLLVASGFADTQEDGSNDFLDSQISEKDLELGRSLSSPQAEDANNADQKLELCSEAAKVARGAATAVQGRTKTSRISSDAKTDGASPCLHRASTNAPKSNGAFDGNQHTAKRPRLGKTRTSGQQSRNPASFDRLLVQSCTQDWITLLQVLIDFIRQNKALGLNGDKFFSHNFPKCVFSYFISNLMHNSSRYISSKP